MRQHTHDLDGKIHDGCPECEQIQVRSKTVDREQKVDQLADRYAKLANRGAP
jgi:hypothetical protein